jgi:hypothetical protein
VKMSSEDWPALASILSWDHFVSHELGRVVPNPNGIPSFSPGLRGTSYPGKIRGISLLPQRGCIGHDEGVLQPRWGWKAWAGQTQGSLADSATAGLSDGIPLGFSEGGTGFVCNGKPAWL